MTLEQFYKAYTGATPSDSAKVTLNFCVLNRHKAALQKALTSNPDVRTATKTFSFAGSGECYTSATLTWATLKTLIPSFPPLVAIDRQYPLNLN